MMKYFLMAFLAAVFCIAGGLALDSIFSIVIGVFEGVGALFFLWLALPPLTPNAKKKVAERKDEIEKEKQIALYKELKANGVTSLATPADQERARLIAKRSGISLAENENFVEYFEQCQKLGEERVQQENNEKLQAEILQLQKTERERHADITKYTSYYGRDKRIAMLSDVISECERAVSTLNKAAEATIRDGKQKELDWATHGGIAAGIAGGAAGLAVAADIQAKNAQIRAQNEAYMQAMAPMVYEWWKGASDYEQKAKEAREALEAAKIKLVADTPMNSVMSRLSIRTNHVKISKSGAVEVQATVRLKQPFTIFDGIPAVVDGTVSADLYQNGVKKGSALLALPIFGVGQAATVEGICLQGAQEGDSYEVKFTPYLLWEMEK